MREIKCRKPAPGSILFYFSDNTVVQVVFKTTTPDNSTTYELAEIVAGRFVETLPPGRWEGVIDGEGNILSRCIF